MAELRDRPGGCRMAGCAILAEQVEMSVIVLVTGGAVQNHLLHGEVRVD